MTSTYPALWLPEAFKLDKFVSDRTILRTGWEKQGRPGSFLPSGHVEHNTACMLRPGHDPQTCINTIMIGNSVAPGPISQLLGTFTPPGVKWNGSNPDPRMVVLAAGRANHAGAGIYRWGAPAGNGSSIGMEFCGPMQPGETIPDVVMELRDRALWCIFKFNNWTARQLTTHWEYAGYPGTETNDDAQSRKIDPSGAYRDEPNLTYLRHWNPDIRRAMLQRRLDASNVVTPAPPQIPTPTTPSKPSTTPKEDTVATVINHVDGHYAQFIGTGSPNAGGGYHCCIVTWHGPGPDANGKPEFTVDHSNDKNVVHQTVSLETMRRDFVLIGDPAQINDASKPDGYSDANFFRVVK